MKKLFSLFSMLMMLGSNALPAFTYANSESEDLAKEILIEELDNVFDSGDLLQGSVITTSGEGNEGDSQEPVITTAELMTGKQMNLALKQLVDSTISNYYTRETNITNFVRYSGNELPENKINIKSENSDNDIFAWYDDGTIYYYSDVDKIYMNEDSSYMFYEFYNLSGVNFKEFDTSYVKSLQSAFSYVGFKSIDLSFMDFGNVENVDYMFQSAPRIENINFEGIIFNKLSSTNRGIFYNLDTLKTLNLSGANFSGLNSMSYMIGYDEQLEYVNFTNANFESSTSISYMLIDSKLKKADFRNVKLGNVTTAQGLFLGVSTLTGVDFSYADLGKLVTASRSDNFIPSKIEEINFEGTNFGSMTDISYWFQSKDNLKELNLSGTNLTNVENMRGMFQSNKSIESVDFSHTLLPKVKNMQEMFESTNILFVNFSGVNLSSVENMEYMFNYSKKLRSVNFHGVHLNKVNDVKYMFQSTEALNDVDFGEAVLGETMYYMFNYTSIESINFSGADFGNVVNMDHAFYSNKKLKSIDFTNLIGGNNIENMSNAFYDNDELTGVDLSNFDLSSVTNMYGMFQYSEKIENINFGDSIINLSGSMYGMFENLRNLESLDLSNFNTTDVTNMAWMFNGDYNLKTIYVSDKFITNNVTQSGGMFNNTYSIIGGNGTIYSQDYTGGLYARIDTDSTPGYFTSILDRPYNILYELAGGVFNGDVVNTYTTRLGGVLPKANMTGFELIGWFESGDNELFVFNQFTKGDKTLYAHWKSLEEKAEETTTENVVYTNTTTVTVGDETTEEVLSGSSTLTLVSKEVENSEVTTEEETTKVQDSEIKVTSDKTVEYEGGLEVYLEKTENVGTENETTGKVEGTIKFSAPVAVKIPISSDVEYVKVQVKHGEEDFGFKGLTLNPVNECNNGEAVNDKYNGEDVLVTGNTNKYATIYTCSASTFVAYTENNKPVENTTTSSTAAGGGRTITTKQETKTIEQEHNSADIVKPETTQTSSETVKAPAIEEQVKKIEGRSLTRGEVAIMTNILLEVYPQLVEGKQELDDVTNACYNYADEQNFTKDEKKAITRLCKLSIMGIHNETNEPLEEFLVNNKSTNDEFSKVINRSVSTYNEKDLSTIKEALKKLEGDEENVVFGTVYDMFMGIKNIFS